tara:strand:+ start:9121 stop:9585 length:465 start_codon:yes stop_codon:yes gene_type:complete
MKWSISLSFQKIHTGLFILIGTYLLESRISEKRFCNLLKKQNLGKKELLALTGIIGRRPSYKLIVKESDWKTYYGSQKDIKQLLAEGKKDEFERTILKMCPNKKSMTYFELKYQMVYQVLEKPDEFFNDNILGKFFTRDLADIEYEDPLEITKH